ncbi:glycosyltransferase family 2 protein [Parapedobacter tibetensis]|uniref:glycosyltransferase family 2 protein n=1 Tax=Parapedobacter tibetensis TaxID=2972951 RepID=UPI00214DC93E|nr:glycosyltransferase family 2 protein [Parapedobacter tibetensis]
MPEVVAPIDYTIVICAYNPDSRLLRRCLDAVVNLNLHNLTAEVILVDNNSNIPLKTLDYVALYCKLINNMRVIEVKEQGVKYARIAGIKMSRGQHIIYFDYDNEPAGNYLQVLKDLNRDYPQVAAWGPGEITVDFIDGISPSLEEYARVAFQERHEKEIAYDAVDEWQSSYPYGTGLCTASFILKEYVSLAEKGVFTLLGRKGEEISSGEDTQMILLCIRQGYSVGVSPSLALKHIIPEKRANRSYLIRLAFGTSFCYKLCLTQVFPYKKESILQQRLALRKIIMQILKRIRQVKKPGNENQFFALAQFIGLHAGVYLVLQKSIPWPLNKIIKMLKLT